MAKITTDRLSLGHRFLAHPSSPVALAMIADLSFVFMDTSVQVLQTRGIPASQVFTGRMWLNTILSTAYYLVYDRQAFRRVFNLARDTRLVWARGLFGALSLAFAYQAMGLLAIADFLTIVNTRPLCVGLICWYWLAEIVSRVQIVASVISFSAVILVVQPEFIFHHQTFTPIGEDVPWRKAIGVGCTVACLTLSSIDLLICRILNGAFAPGDMLYVYVICGSICGPIWVAVSGDDIVLDTRALSWVILFGITTCGVGAQMSVVMALARTTAASVAILGYFQIVFGSALQVVLWSIPPNLIEIIGMAIIIAAGIWSILYGTHPAKEDDGELDLPLLPAASGARESELNPGDSVPEPPVASTRKQSEV